jgi:putative glutamine amidotransferase
MSQTNDLAESPATTPAASSPATTSAPLWIGITTRHGNAAWLQANTRNYIAMVSAAGAIPVILAPDTPATLPDGRSFTPDGRGRIGASILFALDGLILSGGGDVHPRHFGQPLAGAETETIDEKRDELEMELAQASLAADLPLFGICRGCQVLNVAAGGSMIQHLDGHRSPPNGPTSFHAVAINPSSRLAGVVGAAMLPVNTFHHQGMDQPSLAPLFVPAAWAQSDGWLVEAYESQQHRWVLGVQWHPERSFELEDGHRRIWQSFFDACDAYRRGKASKPAS